MKKLLSLIAAIALGLGVAIYVAPADAAKVGGVSISQSSLDQDLAAISASPGFLCYLNANEALRTQGRSVLPKISAPGTDAAYARAFASSWLSTRITGQLMLNAAASEQLKVSAVSGQHELIGAISSSYKQVAGSQIACNFDPVAVVAALPRDFVDREARTQSASTAMLNNQRVISPKAYFDAHQSSFDRVCLSGILVSSVAQANSLKQRLTSGASFADLASQYSLDGSKAKGGDLGCYGPKDAQYRSAKADIASLKVGGVAGPLQSGQGAYALISLRDRTPSRYAESKAAVGAELLRLRGTSAQNQISRLASQASISVSPNYGHWTVNKLGSSLVPPVTPPISSLLNASAG
ncbi:MAG: peptidylprolyl isomerase [Actinomycetes bacterium]